MTMKGVRLAFLNQGWLRVELVNQIYELLKDPRYRLTIEYPTDQPVANNRNGIVYRFLQGDDDYLYMNDDDVIPWRNPLDFVERDLDILIFPCPIYKTEPQDGQPLRWNIHYTTKDKKTIKEDVPGGLRKVVSGGSGALLIARRVLEHPALRGPFMDQYNEDGLRTNSEDLSFCDRARDAGFEVYAALCAPCSHNKPVDLLYLMKSYGKDAKSPAAERILKEQ